MPPATEPDTPVDDATSPWAYRMLLAATVFVGAVSFSLSFHGLYDLLQRVGGLPWWLALLGPLGVDGLTLCAIAATFLLRRAPMRVRMYAWTVFTVPTALSIAGQVVDAHVRHLTAAGMVVAAVSPALFALASHLTVVSRRWSMVIASAASAVADVADEPGTGEDCEPDSDEPADEPRQKRPLTEAQAKSIARRRRARKATYEQIAAGLTDKGYRVSAKTVERWLKPTIGSATEQTDEPDAAPADGRAPVPATT